MPEEIPVDGAKPNTDAPKADSTAIFEEDRTLKTEETKTDESTKETEAKAEESTQEAKAEESKAKPKEAETKATDAGKGADEVEYKLSLPKDSPMDDSVIDEISAYAKEKGLSNEDAQELLDRENDAITQYVADEQEDLKGLHKEWAEEVKADPELGGDKFEETAELARRVVERFGDDDLKEVLNATGFGNYPAVVRLFAKIGKSMSNDKFEVPGAPGGGAGSKSAAETMYGEDSVVKT